MTMNPIPAPQPRHLLKDPDLTREEIDALLRLAAHLKGASQPAPATLAGRNIALLFEKPSTRTRSAFEVAAYAAGAHCTYIDPTSSHLGTSESIEDTARVLGRYYDGIAFRGFDQDSVEMLAANAGVPVWNALTALWHPTQALADLLTIQEHHPHVDRPSRVCFLGNGRDNVLHSLMVSGAMRGLDIRVACPPALRPDPSVEQAARERARSAGATLLITDDVDAAIRDADFLYTDVWVSMGEPKEQWAERIPLLLPFRIDESLIRRTDNPEVKLMHCLPALHDRRSRLGRELSALSGLDGIEISDGAFNSSASLVFEQATNRMHTIAAVLYRSLIDAREGGG